MFSTIVSDSQTLFLQLEDLRMMRNTEGGETRYQTELQKIQNLSAQKIQSIIDVYADLQDGDFIYKPRAGQ